MPVADLVAIRYPAAPMIDLSAPYILYVAIAYGATALTLAGILLIQWRQYRTTQRQLEQFRDKL